MYREMRRKKKQTSNEQALAFLKNAKTGILSTISVDNGYPYSMAVNHVLLNDAIYFHCAKEGHKIDNIKDNNNVSFFAIHKDTIDQEKYTTNFESVHVFGKATLVEGGQEFKDALYEIARKYTGSFFAKAKSEIAGAINKTAVVRIDMEHITGKAQKR